jgi:hypothetical protein
VSSFSDLRRQFDLGIAALTTGYRLLGSALTMAGVNRAAVGTFDFDATGAITGHVSGSAAAGRPHPLSSSGLGYGIELRLNSVPEGLAPFAGGYLDLRFDQSVGVPPAGVYDIVEDPVEGREGAALRNPTALLFARDASASWRGVGGRLRLRSSSDSRGIQGDFTIALVRGEFVPSDALHVVGRFTTR